jgi:hypothetical protein
MPPPPTGRLDCRRNSRISLPRKRPHILIVLSVNIFAFHVVYAFPFFSERRRLSWQTYRVYFFREKITTWRTAAKRTGRHNNYISHIRTNALTHGDRSQRDLLENVATYFINWYPLTAQAYRQNFPAFVNIGLICGIWGFHVIVTYRPVARQRPRNRQVENGRCSAAARARQWKYSWKRCFLCGPLRGYITQPTEFSSINAVQCNAVERVGCWVSELEDCCGSVLVSRCC